MSRSSGLPRRLPAAACSALVAPAPCARSSTAGRRRARTTSSRATGRTSRSRQPTTSTSPAGSGQRGLPRGLRAVPPPRPPGRGRRSAGGIRRSAHWLLQHGGLRASDARQLRQRAAQRREKARAHQHQLRHLQERRPGRQPGRTAERENLQSVQSGAIPGHRSHARFAATGAQINPNFGTAIGITNPTRPPRVIQLSVRLNF